MKRRSLAGRRDGWGIALIVGAFTCLFGILLAADMVVAWLVFHLPNGFFVANNGVELLLVLGPVSLVLTGPGALTTDTRRPK